MGRRLGPLGPLIACQVPTPGPAAPVTPAPFASITDYEAQQAAALDSLDAAVGDARADTLTDCRYVSVGEPVFRYVVFSMTGSNVGEIADVALRVTRLHRRDMRQFNIGRLGIGLPPPEIALINGQCAGRPAVPPPPLPPPAL